MTALVAAAEPFATFLRDVAPLIPAHHAEVSAHRGRHAPAPPWDAYAAHETAGRFFVVALRRAGRLIGYAASFITPSLHAAACIELLVDAFFVLPDERGGTTALRLFREVEREAKRRGATAMMATSSHARDSGRMFRALGWASTETVYRKWIG